MAPPTPRPLAAGKKYRGGMRMAGSVTTASATRTKDNRQVMLYIFC